MYLIEYHSKDQRIYSRNRIIFPRLGTFKIPPNPNKKNLKWQKALVKIFIVLTVAILVAKMTTDAVNPIIKIECSNRSKSIATIICNKQATVVMSNYKYEDLATVIKDSNGNIQMVKLNIIPVNEIISEVAINIQNELNAVDYTDFGIRLGSFFGIKILSGYGPYIKVKM